MDVVFAILGRCEAEVPRTYVCAKFLVWIVSILLQFFWLWGTQNELTAVGGNVFAFG